MRTMADKKPEHSQDMTVDIDSPGRGIPSDVKRVMDHDPFAVSDDEVAEISGEQAPVEESGELQTGATQDEEPAAETDSEEGGDESEEEPAAPVQSEGERLLAEHSTMLARQNAILLANSEKDKKAGEPDPDAIPDYAFDIRPEIADALASEDANMRRAAINAIANGVAQRVHETLRKETREHTQQVVTDYVTKHSAAKTTEDKIVTDFYGTYPQFNTPARRAAVVTIASEIYDGKQEWTPALRDKIATQAAKELNMNLKAGPPGPAAELDKAATEQKKQSGNGRRKGGPRQVGSSSRAQTVAPTPGRTQQDDIADTLFGTD